MKKKTLFLALFAALLVGSASACSDNTNQNGGELKDQEILKNKLDDNEQNKKIFAEFEKAFNDSSYDDFLLNCESYYNDEGFKYYHYKSGFVVFDLNGSFSSKIIYNNNKRTESLYLSNEWVKKIEEENIKGNYKTTHLLNLKDDKTFDNKTEYTYDESGNLLKTSSYIYEDGKWIEQ